MNDFYRMSLLPQYIFNSLAEMKTQARQNGQDIIDFGMGNPDQPTPAHIVEALIAAANQPENHRYSLSNGIDALRSAICDWYQRNFQVSLNPQKEAVVTIGSKEGIAHLALAIISPGDIALVPCPAYPIHTYAFIIAGATVKHLPLKENLQEFLNSIVSVMEGPGPKPKILVLNFPSNPTAQCVDLAFFGEVIAIAKKYGIYVLHDLAYADIVFDDYKAPSILQVSGAKDVAVESYTLSKGYNMPGWRVGFMCGNENLVGALTKMKSYLDYGMFAPIQIAAIAALASNDDCVNQIRMTYQKRRDLLCEGLTSLGWEFNIPQASMFIWAKIPQAYRSLGSLEFAKQLLLQSNVSVSPGIGFGESGDGHVRFSLIEDEQRTAQAVANMRRVLTTEKVSVT
jgi:alanine-synthesizing transaminase